LVLLLFIKSIRYLHLLKDLKSLFATDDFKKPWYHHVIAY